MAKKRGEVRGPTLFDFIEMKKPEEKKREVRDVSEELYQFIKGAGRVSKEEITKWAKNRGLSTAEFFKALENLLSQRKIRKRLDDEGNLIYEAVG
jgi:predicted ABC-class ATPase